MTLRRFVGLPDPPFRLEFPSVEFFVSDKPTGADMQRHAKSSLDTETLKDLSRRTPWPWLRDAVLDWAVIVGAVTVAHVFSNPLTWLLALLVIGNRQHALAILGHDGTHFTLSHDRRLNA